jgi:hypothetical protein
VLAVHMWLMACCLLSLVDERVDGEAIDLRLLK